MSRKLTPYYAAAKGGWRNAPAAWLRRWRANDCLQPIGASHRLGFCWGFTRNHILQEQYEHA